MDWVAGFKAKLVLGSNEGPCSVSLGSILEKPMSDDALVLDT